MNNKTVISMLYFIMPTALVHADCSSILSISNSPSKLDSVCPVPFKKGVIESNYAALQLTDNAGFQQNLPNASVRIGLPSDNEFFFGPPNYVQQTTDPKTGATTVFAGIKHMVYQHDKWMFSAEAIAVPPGGSYYYGNAEWGATFNGILSYDINNQFNLSGMLGISRISEAPATGKYAFNSINPDVVLSYSPNDKIVLYGEIYGQSKIGVGEGAGFNADMGAELLIYPNTLLNLSVGQQVYNYLGGFTHYATVGLVVML